MKNVKLLIVIIFLKSPVLFGQDEIVSNLVDKAMSESSEKKLGLANSLFYFPVKVKGTNPGNEKLKYEEVSFPSKDRTNLTAWLIPSSAVKVKGVIFYSHGNTGSIHSHYGFCSWLLQHGYHIFLYDYRGYGSSEGVPNRKGVTEDAEAALNYVLDFKDWKPLPVISFGHSLGVAKSMKALYSVNKNKRIKGAIMWAGFSSYLAVAQDKVGGLARAFVSDEYAPMEYVKEVSGRMPMLFMHGKADKVVEPYHTELMYNKAVGKKTLFLMETAGHNNLLWVNNREAQKVILNWAEALK